MFSTILSLYFAEDTGHAAASSVFRYAFDGVKAG